MFIKKTIYDVIHVGARREGSGENGKRDSRESTGENFFEALFRAATKTTTGKYESRSISGVSKSLSEDVSIMKKNLENFLQ